VVLVSSSYLTRGKLDAIYLSFGVMTPDEPYLKASCALEALDADNKMAIKANANVDFIIIFNIFL
jgi:TRAP-type uncharacterized transport system substrate-binding protein